MLNNITIAGRLTRMPEKRQTQSGLSVASFTVAVDRDFMSNGERGVDFIACSAFRATADFIAQYFDKGDMIIVNGRLQSRKYTGRDGAEKTAWEVLVNNAYFGSSKRERTEREPEIAAEPEEKPMEPYAAADDPDLPF